MFASSDWRQNQAKAHQGRKHSTETRRKMSDWRKGKKQTPNWINNRVKAFKVFWDKKGRVSELYGRVRASSDYKRWRDQVFKRDGYTCQECGDSRKIDPHHLLPFRVLIEELKYGLTSWNSLFNVDNGITLCHSCHKRTRSYGRKAKDMPEIQLINSLIRLHQQKGIKDEFELFYRRWMERAVNSVKEQLT